MCLRLGLPQGAPSLACHTSILEEFRKRIIREKPAVPAGYQLLVHYTSPRPPARLESLAPFNRGGKSRLRTVGSSPQAHSLQRSWVGIQALLLPPLLHQSISLGSRNHKDLRGVPAGAMPVTGQASTLHCPWTLEAFYCFTGNIWVAGWSWGLGSSGLCFQAVGSSAEHSRMQLGRFEHKHVGATLHPWPPRGCRTPAACGRDARFLCPAPRRAVMAKLGTRAVG